MIPREEYIDHPLYGRRILHFMSPVRWSGPKYEHHKCSNYKVLNKTVEWLPMCHHYILVPHNNDIPDDRENVTLIPFDYAQSVTLNRGHLNAKELVRSFSNFRTMDIDFIFNHQPELTYGIINAIQSGRYGAHTKLFNFFHWVDTPATKPTDVFPDGFIRQLEAIHLGTNTFFHCEESLKYLEKNFKNENIFTGINISYAKERIRYMPLGVNIDVESEPFPLPKNRKILVFNHRWAATTGTRRLVEYTEGLSDEYMVWVTDGNADNPRAGNPAPEHFHVEALDYPKYLYLLKHCYATICFVDGYMTWNLSVQDAIKMGKPSLVFKHDTHKYILGDNYPYYFKTKEDFQTLLKYLPENYSWELPPHDETFQKNLLRTMIEGILNTRVPESKYNLEWYYHILNLQNNAYKVNLLKNSHPDLYSSNVWEGLRLKCLLQGIKDDPTSKFTRLFISDETVHNKLLKELDGQTFGDSQIDIEFEQHELEKDIRETIKKKINREKVNNSKAGEFFSI